MELSYKIEFHTYWHCGSGLAAGADADLLVIKDGENLPYVPGKTIKGLVREAVDLLDEKLKETEDYKVVFGISGEKTNSYRSDSFFQDATLKKEERDTLDAKELAPYLYQTLSSTAITDEGIADANTLRKVQVAVPCELEGEILNIPSERMMEALVDGLKYIKRIGAWRNRGLGRCTISNFVSKKDEEKKAASTVGETIVGSKHILKFKCELLTDVILNQRSASVGNSTTLDFIPGNNFLGIVASSIYKDETITPEDKLKLFHTNLVRFGDAHPANGENRSLRMPACLYFPKGSEEKERTHYVHHLISDPSSEELRKIQLKQERNGFVDFLPLENGLDAVRFKIKTSFAIKSAYDREKRCSMDEQMFGYQSMGKGMTYYFTVEVENTLSDYVEKIKTQLTGKHRVGRSRTAQYGLVNISACDFCEVVSGNGIVKAGDSLIIYADSRLIFLDEDGQPTFQPSPYQLTGSHDDIILWNKCQIRIFQYSPYNYQRRCFDTDRCGIEKGSVIVVKVAKDTDIRSLPTYLGSYQNEGFGKVIYNPDFLKADHNGQLSYHIEPKENSEKKSDANFTTMLTQYAEASKVRREEVAKINKAVNEWLSDESCLRQYAKQSFASQWGNIRNLAQQSRDSADLWDKLFRGEKDNNMKDHDKGYLVHGIAKEKWAGKMQALKEFVTQHTPKAVMVLASEMQKRC